MASTTVKCTVAGHVQGVCYRAATRERALALGIQGWVRNLANGHVELVAHGDSQAVGQLLEWLWQGPAAARVSAVTLDEWTAAVEPGFTIRR